MKLEDNHLDALGRWKPSEGRWSYRFYAQLVTLSCIALMRGMNRLKIEGIEELQRFRHGREKHRGLLTFSNHVSLLDDPMLTANFRVPDYRELRWIAADALNFYGGRVTGFLSSAGKCVPIVRGAGPDQPGFHFILERLKAGDWVHIFPEGGRTRDPNGLLRTPFKGGIGRLITESNPICVPFYHFGMHRVLPIGARLPRFGNQVRVKFGKATDCNEEFLRSLNAADGTSINRALAQWSYSRLRELELSVNPNAIQIPAPTN